MGREEGYVRSQKIEVCAQAKVYVGIQNAAVRAHRKNESSFYNDVETYVFVQRVTTIIPSESSNSSSPCSISISSASFF